MELRRSVSRSGFHAPAGLKPLRLPAGGADRWRRLPPVLRAFVVVVFGLLLGLAAAVTGFGTHVSEPSAQAGCAMSGSAGSTSNPLTATITLGPGTTQVVVGAAASLAVGMQGGAPVACSGSGGGVALGTGGIVAINFALASTTPAAITVQIDLTQSALPCGVNIGGTVGNGTLGDGQVQILAHPGTNLTVGANTFDTGGCTSPPGQGKLKGVGNYLLVANNAAETLSALGESNDPTTVPVTFQAGRTTTAGAVEAFDASTSGNTTLDFSQVDPTCPAASAPCALVINSSGAALTAPSVASSNAQLTEGSTTAGVTTQVTQTTYDYSGGGAVTGFVGLPSGTTTFYGGSGGTYTLSGLQAGVSGGLPAQSQVIAGAGTESYTVTASGVLFTAGTDTDSFTANGSNNTFQGGPGQDTVTATGSNNTFIGGTGTGTDTFSDNGSTNTFTGGTGSGTETFSDTGNSNTFTAGPGTDVFSATGTNNTFTAGSGTDTFTANGDNNMTFTAGTGADTFTVSGSGNTFTAGSGTDIFSDTGSHNTFTAGTGTATFTDAGSTNTFQGGSGQVTVNATGDGNHFLAGSGPDTFYDSDSTSPPTNTLDFSSVLTSGGARLAVNTAGAPEPINGGTLKTGAAAVGTPTPTPQYTFLDAPNSSSSSSFTTIVGANNGSTDFVVGETGGLSLKGQATGNSVAAFGNSGVVANLSGSTQTPASLPIGPSTTLLNPSIDTGRILVGDPTSLSNFSCTTTPADCDSLTGSATSIETVNGPAFGYSTFYAGSSTGPYTFGDQGGNNTFVGSSSPDNFTAMGSNNDFQAGAGNGTFVDPVPGNTIDFSKVGSQLTVNVSGQQVLLTPNDAATAGPATYTFSGVATTFQGSTAGTIFDAGGAADTFNGAPSSAGTTVVNQLSFASSLATPGGPLEVCVVAGTSCAAGEALLGSVDEQFSNISQFSGLSAGNTTFVTGTPSGDTFGAFLPSGQAAGNNVIDYSAASPVTVNIPSGTVSSGATTPTDTISNLTTVFGSSLGGNTFIAGQGSETFGDKGSLTAPGSKGGDAIDFGNVSTSSVAPLFVNVSGGQASGPSGLIPNFTAVAGTSTYTFATNGSDFLNLTGSKSGNTTFLAGNTDGYTFAASSSNDAIDFSAATAQALTIDLSKTNGAVTGFADQKSDTLKGLTTVIGSPNPANTFIAGSTAATYNFTANSNGNTFVGGSPSAGAGTDIFNSNGSNNLVTVGSAPATFNDAVGANNTVNFGLLSVPVTVNVSGQQALQTPNDAATGGGATYTFGTTVTTFDGSTGGTTFDAGTGSDTFNGNGAGNILSFDNLPSTFISPLEVCVVGGTGCSGGEALLGSVPDRFTNITTYEGLPSGNTTFVAGTPDGSTYDAFVPPGQTTATANNSIDFSAALDPVTVSVPAGTVAAPLSTNKPNVDNISNLTTVFGSTLGSNTFDAGQGSETFGDNGPVGKDAIDFGSVATSATTPLDVNISGGPAQVQTGSLSTYTAVAGTAVYTFSAGGSNFVKLTGSNNGNTTFLAGNSGGYTLAASGGNDAIDYSAATANPVTVNLGGSTTSGTVTGFTNNLPDGISGLTTVIGSPKNGNTFTAGSTSDTYTFTANSSGNKFIGGAGIDVFNSNGTNNRVTVGAGNATFNDTAPSNNTFDFSALTGVPVTVNVSGQASQTANDTAIGAGATYTFGPTVTTFAGSPGGTTFQAGAASDTFNGFAGAMNTLTFENVPPATLGPLSLCVVAGSGCAAGEALLGTVPEQFSNITVYQGLPIGNTTFVGGTPNGSTFEATSGTIGNSADFSGSTTGVTVNLTAGTVGTVTSNGTTVHDTITGLTTVIGSAQFGNTFEAGSANYVFTGNSNGNTFDGGAGTGTFSSTGSNNVFNVGTGPDTLTDSGTGNTISFSAVPTSPSTPLNVNVSGTPINNGLSNDTASVGSVIYNFSGGINGGSGFTSFASAASGQTDFHAAGTIGGYSFTGAGPSDTADFSANLCAVTANMAKGNVQLSSGPACTTTSNDSISGISTVVGSAVGDNVFNAGLLGNVFTSGNSSNTLSYAGEVGPSLCINLTASRVGLSCSTGGTSDTFSFPAGTPTIEGSPANDTFQIGAGAAAIEGGGGDDTVDMSQIPAPPTGATGAAVNLATGSITGPSIAGVTFTPGCGAGADLCVTSIKGSRFADTFTANPGALSGLPTLAITGGGGGDFLDLSAIIGSSATVEMPITGVPLPTTGPTCTGVSLGATGYVCVAGGAPGITFTGIPNVDGTSRGGDYFFAGSGAESINDNGNPGTLDYSAVPVPLNSTNSTQGIIVDATDLTGTAGGNVTSPTAIGVTDTFTGIGTFTGTRDNDTFVQAGPGSYFFNGGSGSNTLDLSGAPAGTTVSLTPPGAGCTSGIKNNNGTATGTGVVDTFTCMASVVSSTSEYEVVPGETATVNGGGAGTLVLIGDTTGSGVTVTMPLTATGMGSVTGDGYDFSFTGMSTVNGTPFNDLFVAGNASVIINGGGGDDGVSFASQTAAEVVNLSSSNYPLNANTSVPPDTAVGGDGGTIALNGISNVRGTATGSDIIVAGPGSGTIIGGSGSDTFLPTGGNNVIMGGSGTSTLDLSLLPSYSTFNLGSAAPQQLGAGNGTLAVVPGTISTVIASPSGSTLQAGPGNNITLVGGAGNDWLAAGTGTQTLKAGSGDDTLVGGVGNDTLVGGTQAVTFVPGQGGTDTLSTGLNSPGNILSYGGAPSGAQVNLSNQQFTVGGTRLQPGTAAGGWGASVTNLSKAELTEIIGSPEADTFYTGPAVMTIIGNGGNDLFDVTSGGNTLTAGTGSASQFLFTGPGPDGGNIIDGGGNSTANFSQAPLGVTVNLQAESASGGFGGGFALTGINNVIGSKFADVLIAGGPGQTLTGGEADPPCGPSPSCGDVLQAGPTGQDTLISSGSGNDTFCAQSSCSNGLSVGGGNTMKGGTGDDIFFAKNNAADTITGHSGDTAYTDPQDTVSGIPASEINPS